MQPFGLTESGQKFLHAADSIASEVIRPNGARTDAEARFPRENLQALAAVGLTNLVSAREVGGQGEGMPTAVAVAERIARECASTAMVWVMHNCGTAVIEQHGSEALRREVASGKLTTLAFSERGSRSHFWLPTSSARFESGAVVLDATKQLVTSAGECDLYVWSSRPAAVEGLSSIWAVPSDTPGLTVPTPYDGLGLRGNASAPITAQGVSIPTTHALGPDGGGFDVMMQNVLPWFSLQNMAVSVGLMEGVLERAVAHIVGSSYETTGTTIADFPQVRGYVARMRTRIDACRALLIDCVDAVTSGRDDAMLRVLQSKVYGAETSLEVHDMAMRCTGGAAFRKDTAIERFFRDSRAASVMAPVADAAWDFIGKAVCSMPLFE